MKKMLCFLLLCLFTLPLFAKNTILIVGDSLSAGYGIDPAFGWVALLRQQLHEHGYDYDVVNASISGDTTSQGLARLPAALQEAKPTITIIELGGNDGLRGLAIDVVEKNLQQMLSLVKHANSHAVLIGVRLPPNYGASYTSQFEKLYKTLATKHQAAVVPFFLKGIDDNPTLMQPDNTHPTQAAQPLLLKNVWPTLEKLLTKPVKD